ncbi:hypothetical protein FQA47_016193 [Oryzias melastigma]|uniref:Uncharacterized protein n=1 Tax=Oryzias melastigma TaxID=30732 RepID=A0A834F1F0_ORYME|nr:hypothetical protein FQA47_016193 [Oryzias melastigma]
MADRDPHALPAEVRTKLAELELELSEDTHGAPHSPQGERGRTPGRVWVVTQEERVHAVDGREDGMVVSLLQRIRVSCFSCCCPSSSWRLLYGELLILLVCLQGNVKGHKPLMFDIFYCCCDMVEVSATAQQCWGRLGYETEESQSKPKFSPIGNEPRPP